MIQAIFQLMKGPEFITELKRRLKLINRLPKTVRRFLCDESGPTAVEYAVMLALIVGVCISAVQVLAVSTQDSMDTSSEAIREALGNN